MALTWVSGALPCVLGGELLAPGEGELTAALRLLARRLPRVRHSLDLVLGDALSCCRPFFQLVGGAGLQALALSSGRTELDTELELLMATEPPRLVRGRDVAVWELESEAWRADVHRTLRVLHCERR